MRLVDLSPDQVKFMWFVTEELEQNICANVLSFKFGGLCLRVLLDKYELKRKQVIYIIWNCIFFIPN